MSILECERTYCVFTAEYCAPFTSTPRAYRVLSDRNFRDVVLGLLFLSGLGLVWSNFGLR
jgi:hypothetical protein